jgi:hypothetical protein
MRPGRLFLAGVLAVALAFPATVDARQRGFNPLGALFGGIFGYHRYHHHRHGIARRHEEAPSQTAETETQPTADSQYTRRGRHRIIARPNEQAASLQPAAEEQQPAEDSPDARRRGHHKIAQPQEQAAPREAATEEQQPAEDSPDTRRGRHHRIAQPNEQAASLQPAAELQQPAEQLQLTMQAPPPTSLSSLPVADFASIDDDFFGYVFVPSSYDTRLWAHGERDMIQTVFNKGSTSAPPNCGDQGTKRAAPLIERIEQATRPNEEQHAALRELQAALSKAFDEIRTTCRDIAPITPTARLRAMQERLFAIRDAGLSIRIALAKFYDSLTNEQRAPFDNNDTTASTDQKQNNGTQSAAQVCAAQIQAPYAWPAAVIGRRVRPNEQQRVSLEALQKTLFGMAMYLKGACPSDAQLTPIARLDAAMHRLDGMLYAVIAISPALDDFYGQLSDEQKARFNSIDRAST